MRSRGRPVLIAQGIMAVEVIHLQVGVVSTPTMITMNLQRSIILRMSTTNNGTHHHRETTVTMAVALADTALHATQRTIDPPVPPGHTPKIHLVALMAELHRLHREEADLTCVLLRQVLGTQAISLESLTPLVTTAPRGGARDHKGIAHPPEDRTHLEGGLKHSNSSSQHLRAIVGNSGQEVRAILGDIQALSHLMAANRHSSSITRVHNSSCHNNVARPLRTASPLQLQQERSSSPKPVKLHHRYGSQE